MGKDTEWKAYLCDDRRFADLVNGIVFQGVQAVKADDIGEADTQTGYIRDPGGKKKGKPKLRDTARTVRFGKGQARVGIECEEYVDYSMPLRDLNYNVGEYEKQAAKVRSRVRAELQGLGAGERLYRFRKDSRVSPSVTIILYCGEEEWDGSRALHGILDFTDIPEEFGTWVQDYRMHLVEVRKMEDTSVFRTDVRQVLDFIRFSADKAALEKLVTEDAYYQNMEEDAWDVISRYAKVGNMIKVKDYYREDGRIDMCTALKELLEDSEKRGKKIGEEIGEKRGRKIGEKRGKKIGEEIGEKRGRKIGEKRGKKIGEKRGRKIGEKRAEERLVYNLMESMHLTREQAETALKISRNGSLQ